MPNQRNALLGFTIVEMSIVLVIIGLLVGGVMQGKSMIRSSMLRSVATQANQYIAASQSFLTSYHGLPGDLKNAQSYWGAVDSNAATCGTTTTSDARTCNGNGDGNIDANASASNEVYRVWQHLSAAKLIDGNFTGIAASTGSYSSSSSNSPQGKQPNSLWFMRYLGTSAGSATMFSANYGNYLSIGLYTANSFPAGTFLTAADAYKIDDKMDDGMPATGAIMVYGRTICTNSASTTDTTATYSVNVDSEDCNLMWPNAFSAY